MKILIACILGLPFSGLAFASDTDSVFSCYQASVSGAGLPGGDAAAKLCQGVKN